MRNLNIHCIRAKNILCFGENGIEICFDDYGPIVQIRGINLDYPYSEDDPHASSNAVGKSSLQEIISIGFYGRTVKSPTKNKGNQIINCLANKGEVEILWDDFRLVRSFSKSKTGSIKTKLQLWQSASKIWDKTSEITSVDAQELINSRIGLSHHAFCNVVVFDDTNTYSFLESDAATKREIVENLLDLDQYREYCSNAKEIVRDLKKQIEVLSREYEILKNDVAVFDKRIDSIKQQELSWKNGKKTVIDEMSNKIIRKQKELESTDSGAKFAEWEKNQEESTKLAKDIANSEDIRNRVESAIKSAKEKVEQIRLSRNNIRELAEEHKIAARDASMRMKSNMDLISKLEGMKDGATCPWCFGVINRDNYGPALVKAKESYDSCSMEMERASEAEKSCETQMLEKTKIIAGIESKIREADGRLLIVENKIRKNRSEITRITSMPKPEGNVAEKILESEIVSLKKQLKLQQEELHGDSPYKDIIANAENERAEKEVQRAAKAAELQSVEEELPYYNYWVEAFGDNGIRKFVIDGIIPALNERISYWLQILIEGKLELSFDNKLEETITRNGNPAYYFNASGGEKRRINLAVSQAFAYVMMLNSGNCPSLVFLDEITGGSIDRAGISGIYNMVFELAKERKVFVTTHNENLMDLLHGCETIVLKKENDITVLSS